MATQPTPPANDATRGSINPDALDGEPELLSADEDLEPDWAEPADELSPHDDADQSGSDKTYPRPSVVEAQLIAEFDANGITHSYNDLVDMTTAGYLQCLDPNNAPLPVQVERALLAMTNMMLEKANIRTKVNSKKDDARTPAAINPMARNLSNWQVAQLLLHLHHVIRIAPSTKDTDREYDLMAMYVDQGIQRGLYTTSEDEIRMVARRYNASISVKDFAEVMAILRESSPRRHQCTHRDLIAVNNGIFNYSRDTTVVSTAAGSMNFDGKSLHPFTPRLVFLSKAAIEYVPDALSPVIVHPEDKTSWEIVEWMSELSDDEGVPQLLWEIIGAIIRPHVRWGKTAWFYSESGNNGKGTLCALMRNLCGPRSHTSIPLSDFGKDFALEPLVRANAIIVDENDVGTYIDQAANLKAIVTNDIIQINRKFRMPIAFQFFGFMVQCLNEMPRVKDKSESFYRRQLFVPFVKSFTGAERRYIKNDYLQRREVLEYALWYVLHEAGSDDPGCYYELSEPQATQDVLAEYKEANDPVRYFWAEFREQYVWDLLPFPFLYDHYRAWFPKVSPSGSPLSRQQFVGDIVAIVEKDPQWFCPDKNRKLRPAQKMNDPELLIHRFGLTDWSNPGFAGDDPSRISLPKLADSYRGILRRDLNATTPALQNADSPSDQHSDTAPATN